MTQALNVYPEYQRKLFSLSQATQTFLMIRLYIEQRIKLKYLMKEFKA